MPRAILLLAAFSAAMAQSPDGVNFFSIEKEIELGNQLAATAQASLKAQPDPLLQEIGDKLAAKTDGTFKYRFFAYNSVNPGYEPIALPGGPVFVAQSMIPANSAETAAILAHAMAHIVLRHYTREMTQRDLMQIGRKAAASAVGISPSQPAQMNAQFSPRFEYDADKLAVKLLIDAGYDPQALVEWLGSLPVPKINLALGDRPGPGGRVAAAQRAIEAAR